MTAVYVLGRGWSNGIAASWAIKRGGRDWRWTRDLRNAWKTSDLPKAKRRRIYLKKRGWRTSVFQLVTPGDRPVCIYPPTGDALIDLAALGLKVEPEGGTP